MGPSVVLVLAAVVATRVVVPSGSRGRHKAGPRHRITREQNPKERLTRSQGLATPQAVGPGAAERPLAIAAERWVKEEEGNDSCRPCSFFEPLRAPRVGSAVVVPHPSRLHGLCRLPADFCKEENLGAEEESLGRDPNFLPPLAGFFALSCIFLPPPVLLSRHPSLF
ncbi:hypothetical protein HPB50_018012 [Hyalomma asiaticum]|uniref:Uncharacterized protein n=1 Tax=Hyalomma asiaticum TaxID=266040 RepID=A0ACB7S1M9_HYAAI|nr:hypothetical protein HPB50_018012 [Hyalomma asiaticum]